MLKPGNDYIVIRPAKTESIEGEGPVVPGSITPLREGEVLDMGSDSCVFAQPEELTSIVVSKSELYPGIAKGSKVLYRGQAEDRIQRIDQAYRIPVKTNGKKDFILYIKITDIVAYSPLT